MSKFHFTFDNIKQQYLHALESGYEFLTCEEYVRKKHNLPDLTIVNRIDVDVYIRKARLLGEIFNELGIKGSFFIRLHSDNYNPFSFEGYRVIKFLIDSGHEIGYHSEIIDQSVIWDEDAGECLKRDVDVLNRMFNINITGVASHGGRTGLNNLDFWKDKKPKEFGLLYEAYDKHQFDLFDNSFYISDSEWTRWKCYNNGVLCEGDRRTFAEHIDQKHSLIYLLIHSDTYFHEHFYE